MKRLSGESLPAPSNVSSELAKVILKACAFHPKDRYSSAEEFLAALEGISHMETPGSLPGKPLSFFCALLLCAAALAFMVNTVWDYIGSPKLISVLCNHVWIPADCTTPETCSKCGETRGEAEGHTWLEATCTLMKRCEVCDAAMGTDRYFDDAADRICVPTQYAVNMGADTRILDDGVTTAAWWWLRSPGESSNQASFVNFDGTRYTNAVGNTYLSVRPALWIRLDSE